MRPRNRWFMYWYSIAYGTPYASISLEVFCRLATEHNIPNATNMLKVLKNHSERPLLARLKYWMKAKREFSKIEF